MLACFFHQPLHQASMRRATIKKVRDSLLWDASNSRSNLRGMQLLVTEENETKTYIVPEEPSNMDLWFYHLNTVSTGSHDLNLTHTEKTLTQILKEGGAKEHQLWKHPILNCTTGPLHSALTSLPSKALNEEAANLFQVGRQAKIARM